MVRDLESGPPPRTARGGETKRGPVPQILSKRPSNCSKAELDAFEKLVKQGGEVTGQGLRERILRAEWLVFTVEEDGTFSGISALKTPNDSYKRNIFRKAGAQPGAPGSVWEPGSWVDPIPEGSRSRSFPHKFTT
jgi:hypothetical protein